MIKFSFTESQVVDALRKARRGIARYIELMRCFPLVDVCRDPVFQCRYNGFYKLRQRQPSWYQSYYRLMQELRDSKPSFSLVLDALRREVGKCEASFASKMVATIDSTKPVWDTFVLMNMGISPLCSSDPRRFDKAKANYARIEDWHRDLLDSENGRMVIGIFDGVVAEHCSVSNLKKVDFVLWQTRNNETGPQSSNS